MLSHVQVGGSILLLAAVWTFTLPELLAQDGTDVSLSVGPYWSPDGIKLAYSAHYNGSYDIYVIDVRDRTRERVTRHPSNNLYASWSPDGHTIAFYSDRESEVPPHPPDTVVYNVKGLYETYARDGYKPSWSPDGKTIAAHLRSGRGNYEIYLMNSRARDRRPITWNRATDIHPRFSPDGRKIAFVSDRDYQPELYVMDADGGNQTRLTFSQEYDLDPVWSPDGNKIAFISNMAGFFDIYLIDFGAGGRSVHKLTDSSSYSISPSWSPDGRQILFSSDRTGLFKLFVMKADGSSDRQLTFGDGNEYYGSWAPDGKRIAYLSTEGGESHLYVMLPDGNRKRRLSR